MNKIIQLLIVLVVIVGVGYAAFTSIGGGGSDLIPSSDKAAKEGYSAVFLDNDQVYFGKIATSGKVLILTDIFYIRLNDPQPQQEGEEAIEPQLTLVKLGEQIHGPVDEMRINKEHVLFVERLTDEATVVKAIAEYKDSQKNSSSETPIKTEPAAAETPAADTTPADTTE